jgi:protein-disulfide isomerase
MSKTGRILLPFGLLTLGIILIRLAWPTPKTPPATTQPATPPASETLALIIGRPDAQLTIVEYGDFQCPRCNTFFTLVEPQIRRDYIETGRAKLVFRSLNAIGPESLVAAEGAYCAAEQNQFTAYHDAVFNFLNTTYWQAGRNAENTGALTARRLSELAAGSEYLNRTQFDGCLAAGKYRAAAQAVAEQGTKSGYSLPTFIVGQTVITGVQPYPIFKAAIEAEL